jgi:hypothetical protein
VPHPLWCPATATFTSVSVCCAPLTKHCCEGVWSCLHHTPHGPLPTGSKLLSMTRNTACTHPPCQSESWAGRPPAGQHKPATQLTHYLSQPTPPSAQHNPQPLLADPVWHLNAPTVKTHSCPELNLWQRRPAAWFLHYILATYTEISAPALRCAALMFDSMEGQTWGSCHTQYLRDEDGTMALLRLEP